MERLAVELLATPGTYLNRQVFYAVGFGRRTIDALFRGRERGARP
jgi:hypothetical protein